MAKTQVKCKWHLEAELSLPENCSHFLCALSSKNNRRYSKKWTENINLFKFGYMINDNENEAEIEI